ncbi:histidinol phosphate phosphatase domain-containing protein [Oceanidesulfovibrio marinus]|uniref:Histidinol phosphate phosphatase domain-containing protein n=1 Tax=Oceanidesulfovibrio marinus TaxID=370038 RepID=A0A6P1ZHQ8_9BACT|nr:histidinol phosphate phosphatase domain-containing protein [Oceanidesulfovibrio marinus]QJT10661.1 histidinol phosphate phosphatase domain-containing protein [Oceanidesulfovibrio marinus]TVM34111.1 PHP domain-containing protein [Oceanidesulfovibrio marinus]
MIDCNIHTTVSDGRLVPAEAAARARAAGCRAVILLDHADTATLEHTVEVLRKSAEDSIYTDVDVFVGVELTFVPPALLSGAVARARELGAQLVAVHGESILAPVAQGTNLAAIESGADLLAHPGILSHEEAALAAERGVHLEISLRAGHCLANGLVASLAREHGVKLLINSGAHEAPDFLPANVRRAAALGAGLSKDEYDATQANARALIMQMLAAPRG